ncbi:MAG: N-acetylmuramoyl-L-alanine amidase AmiA precursor [Pelotomaculum sp. PtaB.Bin104]|nr:MAG: N-acetylmuramoyl-L-alanine amidase AmiA precursor [Pelotomaculum sp. PtaB.Bin104]
MELMARICIDPGYGGSDPGAIGPSGLQEKVVTLAVVKKLAYILKAAGAQVKLTREDDSYVSLAERVAISNDFGADVFISIHANAATSPQAKGIEVWTTWGQTAADPLAESIANSLRAAFPGLVFRADMSDGDQDKEANFQVLYYTKAPAVLVELGFITNSTEEELLNIPIIRDRLVGPLLKGCPGIWGSPCQYRRLLTRPARQLRSSRMPASLTVRNTGRNMPGRASRLVGSL